MKYIGFILHMLFLITGMLISLLISIGFLAVGVIVVMRIWQSIVG